MLFRSVFQCRLQGSHILLAELGQHPVRQIILGIWLRPHAYADTGEFLRAQLCDNALDAVVSAGTALSPQPQLSRRQGDVIINDQHLLRRDLVEVRRRRNGIAAEESLYLAGYARKVTMIHKGPALTVSPMLKERLDAEPKIHVLCNEEVEDVGGDENDPLRVMHFQEKLERDCWQQANMKQTAMCPAKSSSTRTVVFCLANTLRIPLSSQHATLVSQSISAFILRTMLR